MRMERVRWRDTAHCKHLEPRVCAMSARHARKMCQKNVPATRSVCIRPRRLPRSCLALRCVGVHCGMPIKKASIISRMQAKWLWTTALVFNPNQALPSPVPHEKNQASCSMSSCLSNKSFCCVGTLSHELSASSPKP